MPLEHIVVASDESDAGRSAVRAGLDLANRAQARLTFMTVMRTEHTLAAAGAVDAFRIEDEGTRALASACFGQWLEAELVSAPRVPRIDVGVAYGIPGVEICRFAEERQADLLVVGRKPRSHMTRLLLGDTADAVARRSLVPSLYVPPHVRPLRRLLVALDGTDRGFVVFRAACALAAAIGASVRLITVEPEYENEPEALAKTLPTARTMRLLERIEALVAEEGLRCLSPEANDGRTLPDLLVVRRGDPVEQVLSSADQLDADVVVVGYRRGGPPGVVEGGSVARRLAHQVPCALLAVPL